MRSLLVEVVGHCFQEALGYGIGRARGQVPTVLGTSSQDFMEIAGHPT